MAKQTRRGCDVVTYRVILRAFGDFTVNSTYRSILLGTTAILLSTEGPIDFVKDVLAIQFISTLDDPEDGDDNENNKSKTLLFQHIKNDEDLRAEFLYEEDDQDTCLGRLTSNDVARIMLEQFDKGRQGTEWNMCQMCKDFGTCFSRACRLGRVPHVCTAFRKLCSRIRDRARVPRAHQAPLLGE